MNPVRKISNGRNKFSNGMKEIEALINQNSLTDQELDFLITMIRQDYWPKLKANEVSQHCGVCMVFKFCRLINPKLLCPWLQK